MTSGAVDALQADRDALVEIGRGLSDDDWRAMTGWAGWTVQDLMSHLAGGLWAVVDPSALPDIKGLPTALAQQAIVDAHRSWTPARVLDDYAAVSQRAIDRLATLDGREHRQPFGELGTYPASMVPNSFAFDHYTHIRVDLFAPRGPLTSVPPPSDEMRLLPALDWITAALPQQNTELVESLPGALAIEVRGIGARTITVGPGEAKAKATVGGDAASLIRWITGRDTWDEAGLSVTGDPSILDRARQIRVA
jgi:uncharacterized protein (TIGR03083 family)